MAGRLPGRPSQSELRPPAGAAPAAPRTEAGDPGPNLVAAIERQLGLRLAPGKATIDVVVVDQAEKVPTGN